MRPPEEPSSCDASTRDASARDADRELLHPALADGGRPLDGARLTELERLSLVFQAAALLSHLEHGGFALAAGWDRARVTADGLLQVAAIRPGRAQELTQVALRRLLARLFRSRGELKGRGIARRAARHLAGRWQQTLAPATPDKAVADVLEAAPFLWQPSFAAARTALVAEHRVGGERHLWLAGPGHARRRFLARGAERPAVEKLLRDPRARDLWEGWRESLDPRQLAAKGRWRQAVAAWSRQPPRRRGEHLAYARSLFALGRYAETLEVLKRRSRFAACLLRAWCQYYLGELNAAQATVRALADRALRPEQVVELAEIAVRLLAARGRRSEIRRWIARALANAEGKVRLAAWIVAAGAAWDLGDLEAMDRYLTASRLARDDPELAGKWHHARGLRALEAVDGLRAAEHVGKALALDRRRLLPAEAGRLWNDLGIGRAYAEDLPAAERAFRHALRLLSDCQGPSRTTLALYNLAEVRIRRGRTSGVESILETSTAENRRAGNQRGLIRDLELWVRLELSQGRAVAALARCAEARQECEGPSFEDRRRVFEVLAARAHGWLGRQEQAAACLEAAGPEAARELESEERPAVWALAGLPEPALDEAAGTPWASLWAALVAGAAPPHDTWRNLTSLEPFRAARLVFDGELVHPGAAPPERVRGAISTFRRMGAEALAERLESRSLSPWRALAGYLAQPVSDARAVAELLAAAGYCDARLSWLRKDREEIVVAGVGGREELSETVGDGRWVLRSTVADSVLKTLFALIRRDLRPPRKRKARRRPPPASSGIVGKSSVLLDALERLDQLARGDLPILVLGESGTGKELFARRAHRLSRRAAKSLLPMNCAALSETLIQSDLFGHVKGSFTGADRDRAGVFESVRGGTVFLDEIGDLPLAAQGKLLRVLQEGEIRRVGESFSRKVDVRMVAATHRNLEQMVAEGSFRQDLFYRLKVATVSLPPLRHRGDDILLLADHFLAASPGDPPCLTRRARARLLAHPWPGNIRELRNVLEVAVTLEHGGIDSEHLDLPKRRKRLAGDYHQQIDGYRKQLISEALAATGGNRSQAARRLGLSRQALSYLIRQLELS